MTGRKCLGTTSGCSYRKNISRMHIQRVILVFLIFTSGHWLQSMRLLRSRTRLSDFTFTFHFHALETEMATHSSVLAWRIPGRGSLVGCRLWGRTESGMTEVTPQQQQIKIGRRQWHPSPVLLPGKSHGQRSLEGCSPWGRQESATTERLHFHFSLSCIGEGNGNPLQCSCLEDPRDRGAWWAAIYGVAQSWTRLKRLSSSSSSDITYISLIT